MAEKKDTALGDVLIWMAALAVALAAFYGLDHFVMGIQGLPLSWDLAPAN